MQQVTVMGSLRFWRPMLAAALPGCFGHGRTMAIQGGACAEALSARLPGGEGASASERVRSVRNAERVGAEPHLTLSIACAMGPLPLPAARGEGLIQVRP